MIKRIQSITKNTASASHYIFYLLLDAIERLLGRRDDLMPPKRKIAPVVSPWNFKEIGFELSRQMIELGRLKPQDRVLEVGCGIGRAAIALTKYLNGQGSYVGFDVISSAISWCQKNITPRCPRFHFQLADIYNRAYNPKGKYKAAEYRFPFADESFDYIFLTSVFTHLLPKDLENYFSQIARVLKRGGNTFITYFLIDEVSSGLMKEGKSMFNFSYNLGGYFSTDLHTPESAVAYDEKFILNVYEKYGFQILDPIHRGSWCGRANARCGQDTIIAVKK
jgi:SAM-dependent methyltransferase